MGFIEEYLSETRMVVDGLDTNAIEKIVDIIVQARSDNGRMFFLGVGGGAANASHAVNDFRKIVGIEAYAPTDNIAELTARANDDGWASIFVEWLKNSHLREEDILFVFSVGGGDLGKNVSPNVVSALQYAQSIGVRICGIVGRDSGYTAKIADACVVIPEVNSDRVTPHTEAFQSVILHLLVSHPKLKVSQTKWESIQ